MAINRVTGRINRHDCLVSRAEENPYKQAKYRLKMGVYEMRGASEGLLFNQRYNGQNLITPSPFSSDTFSISIMSFSKQTICP